MSTTLTQAGTAPPATPDFPGLRAALPALLLGLAGFAVIFQREIAAAVDVWEKSTAYNHCFLVIPIALWMAWERRDRFRHVPARPAIWAAPAALGFAGAWFIADRIGIMEGRQLAAMGILQVMFFAVLGPALWRRLAAPLIYLIFLVPFGAFLTPTLQDITTVFVTRGLDLLGILHFSDGYIIEIPAGTFLVAEACAGLRFLIAAIAFGTLYACTIYRSPWRRAAFILASIIVPIIANGFRALGIVLAGHYLGNAEAAAADHVIYGWGFFSIVLLLLILIGLPFREDRAPRSPDPAPAPSAATPRAGLFASALAVMLLAASGPAIGMMLDANTRPPAPAGFDPGGDCTAAPVSAPVFSAGTQRFVCASGSILLDVAVFAPRVNPGQLVLAQRHLSGEAGSGESDASSFAAPDGTRWRLLETREPHGLRATALWLDGKPATLGLAARIAQARSSLTQAGQAPVMLAIQPRVDWRTLGAQGRGPARQMLAAFLVQHPDLAAKATALAASAGR
jgi:exosortase A